MVAREHVIDLALDGEGAAIDDGLLCGFTDEAEVAGFLGQNVELELPDDFLSASVGADRDSGVRAD